MGGVYSCDGSGAIGEAVAVLTCLLNWAKSLRVCARSWH